MDGLDLLADEIDGRPHVAIVRKGVLVDLYVDSPDRTGCWASLYLGKVVKIDTKLNAAFVDLGNGLMGYLSAKHVCCMGTGDAGARGNIGDLLKGGQMILVQIKAEGKRSSAYENNKLPRLTMKLHLQGLFLTYSPQSDQVTIPAYLEGKEVTALTSRLKGKGGWIVQRSIENATEADVEQEAARLRETWQKIIAAAEARQGRQGLIQEGPNALSCALVDYGALHFEHIHVGNRQTLDLITKWCAVHFPALATSKRLRLFRPEKQGQTLFDIYDVYSELESLKDAQIYLNDGGTIIIEYTSAMTVIDVNQGSAGSISEINQAAAKEVVRQIRLRSISGAILVDFINMDQKAERVRLLEALELSFLNDIGSAQVHGFTRLGIIEITRKRRTASLLEKLRK